MQGLEELQLSTLKRAAVPGRTLVIGGTEAFVRQARNALLMVAETVALEDFIASPGRGAAFENVLCATDLAKLPEQVRQVAVDVLSSAAKKTLIVRVTTTGGPFSREPGSRADWEARFLAGNLRRHANCWLPPAADPSGACLLSFETLAQGVREQYPLTRLHESRGLHMDMLREPGLRADAHLRRYEMAALHVSPDDHVLDAACGLGYGCEVLRRQSLARRITGVDQSSYATDYARISYGGDQSAVSFLNARLPEAFDRFDTASVDVVVSFETLEHVENPEEVIAAYNRVLRPGGRLIVSVPNDWADETGTDPNPEHLHVYDWPKLEAQLSKNFLIGSRYSQIGSRIMRNRKWTQASPSLVRVPLDGSHAVDAEWWLAVAHRSPFDQVHSGYRDNLVAGGHAARHRAADRAAGFDNPWLVPVITRPKTRPRDSAALRSVTATARAESTSGSAEAASALCTDGYGLLASENTDAEMRLLIEQIDSWLEIEHADPWAIRWRISLLYLKARLQEDLGLVEAAMVSLQTCLRSDFLQFDPVIATKVTQSGNRLAAHQLAAGDMQGAMRSWGAVVEIAAIAIARGAASLAPDGTRAPPYLFAELAEIAAHANLANGFLCYLRQPDDYAKVEGSLSARVPETSTTETRRDVQSPPSGLAPVDLANAELHEGNQWCRIDALTQNRSCILHPPPRGVEKNPCLIIRGLQPRGHGFFVATAHASNPSESNSGARLAVTARTPDKIHRESEIRIAPRQRSLISIEIPKTGGPVDMQIEVKRFHDDGQNHAAAIRLSGFNYL
ncbi:MAG: class I SAM-dependent methyltransferase [Pseudomonadota bacterium]